MITLRIVVDSMADTRAQAVGRYTEELTRAIIATAPRGCEVEGIVSATSEIEQNRIRARLPGLIGLHVTPLARRELRTAWQHTITTGQVGGMIHSPDLLAPLRKHDRSNTPGQQTVVTIHDALPWLYPSSVGARGAWMRQMTKRALKYADAIVVPTHAVASDLTERLKVSNRLRVIGGAANSALTLPDDEEEIAARLRLPSTYLLAVTSLDPRKGLRALLTAATRPEYPGLPLVIVGARDVRGGTFDALRDEVGLDSRLIQSFPAPSDSELAVIVSRATAMVQPSLYEGSASIELEALQHGVPVIHSDVPALVELLDGAGVIVERAPEKEYADRLAAAISATLANSALMQKLTIVGEDRARAFSWRDSAEKVWNLHADL